MSTSAWESLGGVNALRVYIRVILTKNSCSGIFLEFFGSIDGHVVLINYSIFCLFCEDNFGFFDTLKYIWFPILMSVNSNTQINLVWWGIFFETVGQFDNGILFSFLDMVEESVAILFRWGKVGWLRHLFDFILLIHSCDRTQGHLVPTKVHLVSNGWKPPSFGGLLVLLHSHHRTWRWRPQRFRKFFTHLWFLS